jgi:DNA-binding MarR family transcriptional regulator
MELLFSVKHNQQSTGELAKQFSITSSAVSQMVDQLERKKLVERVQNSDDRRVTYVKLAHEARKVFDNMRTKYVDHLSERFTDISNQELETLLKILEKTIKHVGKEPTWKK